LHLTKKFYANEELLINECKKFSGSYINNLNKTIAPFATTYSTEFCDAGVELIALYKKHSVENPLNRLLEQFNRYEIRTCRGLEMNEKRIEYLFFKFLANKVKNKLQD
jgi:hypothetical protein